FRGNLSVDDVVAHTRRLSKLFTIVSRGFEHRTVDGLIDHLCANLPCTACRSRNINKKSEARVWRRIMFGGPASDCPWIHAERCVYLIKLVDVVGAVCLLEQQCVPFLDVRLPGKHPIWC